jgi:arginine-tRNA-protein transferase
MKQIMSSTPRLNFFATEPHPCSYLPDQEATTVFADPAFSMNPDTYEQLSELGFRRSGRHVYRPHCQRCDQCIPLRIPVHHFKANRQQKRCWSRNQDLQVEISEDIRSGEHYALYERYICLRHRDGDMYPPSPQQYESFLATPAFQEGQSITHYIEFRKEQRLLGVAVTDILASGLSAIYTFFEPDEDKRSLGTFAVLFQVKLAQKLGLPHLYLGYWVEGSQKMAYKRQYRPHELFIKGNWTPDP